MIRNLIEMWCALTIADSMQDFNWLQQDEYLRLNLQVRYL